MAVFPRRPLSRLNPGGLCFFIFKSPLKRHGFTTTDEIQENPQTESRAIPANGFPGLFPEVETPLGKACTFAGKSDEWTS